MKLFDTFDVHGAGFSDPRGRSGTGTAVTRTGSTDLILPVILCGGSGTRLWPASRESMPKQFSRLVDENASTFQATAR
ncbi:MAG: sugar phosphate nucleotidyltransferase, partial [Methylobacterium sp.]